MKNKEAFGFHAFGRFYVMEKPQMPEIKIVTHLLNEIRKNALKIKKYESLVHFLYLAV